MAGLTEKTISAIKSIIGIREKNPELPRQKLCITVNGLPEDTFFIIDFKSEGALNRCYRAEATLASENPSVDMSKVVHSKVFAFSEENPGSFMTFTGFVYECEQLGCFSGRYFYRIVLGPRLSLLTRIFHNQIFLDKTTKEILEEILTDGGLMWDEFEFRLQGDLSKRWEYVCQYRESHFDFFCRWLEREVLYFYFEPADGTEKLIITDTRMSHSIAEPSRKLLYRPQSGLESGATAPVLESFTACQILTPGTVTVKDYNYRRPSLDLTGTATIDPDSSGDVFFYGDHLQSPEESSRIAKIRAEAIACKTRQFRGASNATFIRSGLVIEVGDHFRNEYNRRYLVTTVAHEAHQQMFKISGLDKDDSEREKKPRYRNTFTAIQDDVQYRPPLNTQKPRFHGVINAQIDSDGSGKTADIDEHGRYKVLLPFDLAGRKGGKASAWLRMAQPYAGEGHGMHFPLHKGTEVLLTFVDGDPDRPIIAAAVPNPLTPSVVNSSICTQSRITTAGGNKIHLEDQEGQERIMLKTPNANSSICLGTTKETEFEPTPEQEEAFKEAVEGVIEEDKEKLGISLYSTKGLEVEVAYENKLVMGEVTETVLGADISTVIGSRNHLTFIDLNEVTVGMLNEFVLAVKFAAQLCAGAEYTPEKLMISTNKTAMHTLEETVHGLETKIGNVETDIKDMKTQIKTTSTELAESKILLSANNKELLDTQLRFSNKITEMKQNHTALANSVSYLNNTTNNMASNMSYMVQNYNSMFQTQCMMGQNMQWMSNQMSHLSSTITWIASNAQHL